MYEDWVEPDFLTWDILVDSRRSSRYRNSKENLKSYMSQSGRTNIPSSNSTFLGIGQRFDVKFVLTSVVINDVEDNLTVLANLYGFDAQKLIIFRME